MDQATIKDVAALAMVSIKTVSRVLNRETYVRKSTQERVLNAVKELNYRPSLAARALAGSKSYLVSLYFNNPSMGYMGSIQQGALKACREAGYHLLIEQIDDSGGPLEARIDILLSTVKVDGVVLTPPICDQIQVLEALEALSTPYVRLAPATQLERAPYINMDDQKASSELVAHLIGLGHRKIAIIRGPANHGASALRYAGFAETMTNAGIPLVDDWIVQGDFSFASGILNGEALLRLPDPPTAIFASNDDMALGALSIARKLGVDVPSAVSIAGFDDNPAAQAAWPQLTTVRQPISLMAETATRMLLDWQSDSKSAPVSQTIGHELLIRGSTSLAP